MPKFFLQMELTNDVQILLPVMVAVMVINCMLESKTNQLPVVFLIPGGIEINQ
jgi:H+/Cl- antiporter ClcA